jgi:energy-converting hydrogenase Eha subunit G
MMKAKDDLVIEDPKTSLKLTLAILAVYGILMSGFLGVVVCIYGITHLIIR